MICTNSTVSIKRRTTTTGNKKADSTIESGIPAFISDLGTTADHEQTYLILMGTDITSTINPDTDTINDGTNDYKCANVASKNTHISIRAIKKL